MTRLQDALYLTVGTICVDRSDTGVRLSVSNAWNERVGLDLTREQAEQLMRELWAAVGGSFDPMAKAADESGS